jgi:two-component system OmpR family sensor kinase
MSELITERMVYFTGMIEAKKLKLIVDIEENIILDIDKNDAVRLIDNLLSNAIKYNKHQGVLKVSLNKIYFAVKDTGIGIEAKDLDSILHRFKRANKSEGGFGIGLDIVNQVIQSYHYHLKIVSKVDEGTEVRILWKK